MNTIGDRDISPSLDMQRKSLEVRVREIEGDVLLTVLKKIVSQEILVQKNDRQKNRPREDY